jgi:signal transduction histidine kinase
MDTFMVMEVRYNPTFVFLSVVVAIFASYTALDLANSVTQAKGRARTMWLACGSLAMGIGIWSMHFVGMLAFEMPGMFMAYDVPLAILSVGIAIGASALALFIVSRPVVPMASVVAGGIAMAAAIAGMHYTGMLAATFIHADVPRSNSQHLLLATSQLAVAVVCTTALILGLALAGTGIDRAFTRRSKMAEKSAHLHREAEKAISALEQEKQLRDRFVTALAHDLRTPLTAAKTSAQLSIRQSTSPDQVEKLSGRVVDAMDRADQMVQDLLDAHRISAGQMLPLQKEHCDVKEFLTKITEDLATAYGDRFNLKCDDGLEGYWDPKYLRRAIENLCTNALKYGQDGAPILLRAEPLGGMAILSVHNRGEPIKPEDEENLFQLFHRGTSAQTAGKHGWGLGLTIVKGIAEAHGGRVRVESSRERGTTFFIDLPIG